MTQKARPTTTRSELLFAAFMVAPELKIEPRKDAVRCRGDMQAEARRCRAIAQRGCAYERERLKTAAVGDEQQQIKRVLSARVSIKWPTHGRSGE
jgi:hypothetical protein